VKDGLAMVASYPATSRHIVDLGCAEFSEAEIHNPLQAKSNRRIPNNELRSKTKPEVQAVFGKLWILPVRRHSLLVTRHSLPLEY
jgi:hypothetical protein